MIERARPSAGGRAGGPPRACRAERAARTTGACAASIERASLLSSSRPLSSTCLRFRVHVLMSWLKQCKLRGIVELTPGVRSLQVHFDPQVLSSERLLSALESAERELGSIDDVEVPTRTVHLPLSWDDPQTQLAIQKYVTSGAPTRLGARAHRVLFASTPRSVETFRTSRPATWCSLGDVYLGAPVATPIDPRHRWCHHLHPARTWTPEMPYNWRGGPFIYSW